MAKRGRPKKAVAAQAPVEVAPPQPEHDETALIKVSRADLQMDLPYAGRVGLQLPSSTTFAEWLKFAQPLNFVQQGVLWWVGDYLNFGEKKFGDTYSQALGDLPYAYDTLVRCRSIANKIPINERRQDLSFAHHVTVAKLSSKERAKWLEYAANNGLNIKELRVAIKAATRVAAPDGKVAPLDVLLAELGKVAARTAEQLAPAASAIVKLGRELVDEGIDQPDIVRVLKQVFAGQKALEKFIEAAEPARDHPTGWDEADAADPNAAEVKKGEEAAAAE